MPCRYQWISALRIAWVGRQPAGFNQLTSDGLASELQLTEALDGRLQLRGPLAGGIDLLFEHIDLLLRLEVIHPWHALQLTANQLTAHQHSLGQ